MTRSAFFPSVASFLPRVSPKNLRKTGMPFFSAKLAVLSVGSIPKQGIPAFTKFFSRYPSFEATSITKLSELRLSSFSSYQYTFLHELTS